MTINNMQTELRILFMLLLTPCTAHAQTPVTVAETTIKVSGLEEETLYYGFAEGDQLVFSFREVNGKELKEIEIGEVSGSSLFMDFKTKNIATKTFHIGSTGIYKFRLANGALGGRVCQVKIQRIPADESLKKFNTTVYWRTEYDTIYTPEEERYLVKTDTSVAIVMQSVAKVPAKGRTIVDFNLPDNTRMWSYYIGVGDEGQKAYEASKNALMNNASASLIKIPGYGPLAALALQGINVFIKAGGGDNVQYWFITDWNNVLAFKAGQQFLQYKQGNVINEASQMKLPLLGKVYLGLMNDNIMDAIEVQVKVTAIQFRDIWATRTVQRMDVTSTKIPYLKN